MKSIVLYFIACCLYSSSGSAQNECTQLKRILDQVNNYTGSNFGEAVDSKDSTILDEFGVQYNSTVVFSGAVNAYFTYDRHDARKSGSIWIYSSRIANWKKGEEDKAIPFSQELAKHLKDCLLANGFEDAGPAPAKHALLKVQSLLYMKNSKTGGYAKLELTLGLNPMRLDFSLN